MPPGENVNSRKLKKQLQSKSAERRSRHAAETAIVTATHAVGRNDLQPTMAMLHRPVHELKASTTRSRETTPELLEKIIRSIKTFGLVLPILIEKDGTIVVGHALWEAAIKLGLETIECRVVEHLDPTEIEALSLAINRIGESGKYSLERLRDQLIRIESAGIELVSTGFTLPEIGQIMIKPAPTEEDEGECDGGREDEIVVTKTGDYFQLGDHRLVCGDALDEISWRRVLEGRQAQCVFSDAPYNCPIKGFVGGFGRHQHDDFLMFAGKESEEEFAAFLEAYLTHCRTFTSPGAVIFAAMDWRQIDVLLQAGRAAGLSRINVAVWNKGAGGMGSTYRSAHEFFAVFCNGKSAATNNIALGVHGRDRTNVWTFPGANRKGSSAARALEDHPTPKPVELVLEALLDVTNPGDVVLDPFLGSGTTIIAAEQCGRRACGIELDPKYIDRTIRRWEKLTGEEAVHVRTNLTFAELAERRDGQIDTDIDECSREVSDSGTEHLRRGDKS
ncbi:DNA modification methylase [Caenibius sp. WL]|uniref:DNA modification methylase n=1 Tax=Caenibius sp. WL TaxID=2872646 RepID=UPI001C9998B3|nr:DNA modification methylase [Caenibius sp. WL]QZP07730.1 DNA modification methylase [Caenibius sp. WL]